MPTLEKTVKNIAPPMIKGYCFSNDKIARIMENNRWIAKFGPSSGKRFALASIFIELEPICNFNCLYCYTGIQKDRPEHGLSSNEIKGVIHSARFHGAESVVVAGDGEPMLSRHVWTVIEDASRKGMIPVIFTNGSIISKRIAKELHSNNASIILKMNSFRPHIQDFLIGIPGGHKLVYRAVKILLEAGFRAPRFAIQSLITNVNMSDLREIFLFCRQNSIIPYIETYVAMGRGAQPAVRALLEPARNEIYNFFLELQEIDESMFNIRWETYPHQRVVAYGACNKNGVVITISSNGDVYRCVTESKKLANIREKPLEEILSDAGIISALVENRCIGCESVTL